MPEKRKQKEKLMALESVVKALNKKFGVGTIGTPKDLGRISIDRMSTGIFPLDVALGGGWPKGRIIEMIGELSAGKTYAALRAAVECQKMGKEVVYVDAENSFDKTWAEKIGVDVDRMIVGQPSTGEQSLDIVDAVVRDNSAGLVIIDSVGAIGATSELEDSMEKHQMGVNARMMNKAIRKIHAGLNVCDDEGKPNQTIVLFINQIRLKIGVMYGSPETTPGGKGLGFGASVRVKIRKTGFWELKLNDQKENVGQHCVFDVIKNKTYPPYKKGRFLFNFRDVDYIDDAEKQRVIKAGQQVPQWDVPCTGVDVGFFERAGSTYKYKGKTYRGEGHLIEGNWHENKLRDDMRKEISDYTLKMWS